MSVKTIPIRLDMRGDAQIENITKRVQEAVGETGLKAGIATVFIRHTTASVMLIEDEPGIPADAHWQHNTRNPGEDNAHSHLRGHLQGPSVTIPFTDGALLLGTWQQIVVVDFDTRPRKRDLVVQVVGE